MTPLALHEFHRAAGAAFLNVNGQEAVSDYGDWMAEYAALREGAGVLDLSFRGRLCVLGADRQRFLNGQVTNNAVSYTHLDVYKRQAARWGRF